MRITTRSLALAGAAAVIAGCGGSGGQASDAGTTEPAVTAAGDVSAATPQNEAGPGERDTAAAEAAGSESSAASKTATTSETAVPRTRPSAQRKRAAKRSAKRRRTAAGTAPATAGSSPPAPAATHDAAADEAAARSAANAVFPALAARDADAICHRLYSMHRIEVMAAGKKGDAAVADCEQRVRKGTPITLKEMQAARSIDADTVDVDAILMFAGQRKPTRMRFKRSGGGWQLDATGPQR